MHVRPRRSRQHVWESKDRLPVQSVAGGAQPAGNVLGETTENLPSHSPAVHPSAAQPGTDAHANPAAQIDGGPRAEGTMPGKDDLTKLRLRPTMSDRFETTQNAFLHIVSNRFLFWISKSSDVLTVTKMF